ncbi:hypothetical protein [Streptomyces sp. PT19]|uniref:hypothetical protein n=1 Tax=Streptomyces sp. PT19 TaxID=3452239 RepID=UPI003F8206E7
MELTILRGWMRNTKRDRTFGFLARKATKDGMPVSEYTLRQAVAVNGRLPTRYTVLAFARGAGADEEKAALVWEAAAGAVRPAPVLTAGDRYVPGRFTTRGGLVRAMDGIRAAAGSPSLEAVTSAGGGRFSRSALHDALTGRRLASEQLLIDYAAAVGGEKATRALLDGRARIVDGPLRPPALYVCDMVDRAEGRRQDDERVRSWLVEPELDWYDQQLRDDKEAEYRRMIVWVDSLTDAEVDELQQQARLAAGAGGDLRAKLTAYLARSQHTDDVGG